MVRHPKVSNYFIWFKVKIYIKLKPKAYSFKEKTVLNKKNEYTAWDDDSENWTAGLCDSYCLSQWLPCVEEVQFPKN